MFLLILLQDDALYDKIYIFICLYYINNLFNHTSRYNIELEKANLQKKIYPTYYSESSAIYSLFSLYSIKKFQISFRISFRSKWSAINFRWLSFRLFIDLSSCVRKIQWNWKKTNKMNKTSLNRNYSISLILFYFIVKIYKA